MVTFDIKKIFSTNINEALLHKLNMIFSFIFSKESIMMIMFITVILLSSFFPVTSRTINSNNTIHQTDEQYFHLNKSYISTHRLIFAKLILLSILGCFFWICSCQMIIRQIYTDKKRLKCSMNTQGNVSTIPIKHDAITTRSTNII